MHPRSDSGARHTQRMRATRFASTFEPFAVYEIHDIRVNRVHRIARLCDTDNFVDWLISRQLGKGLLFEKVDSPRLAHGLFALRTTGN